MIYYPDSYTLLHFKDTSTNKEEIKVFAGFYGGYAYGDAWKLSSGTSSIKEIIPVKRGSAYKNTKGYEFKQYSGSSYVLSLHEGKHTTWIQSILCGIMQQFPEFKVISLQEAITIMKGRNETQD